MFDLVQCGGLHTNPPQKPTIVQIVVDLTAFQREARDVKTCVLVSIICFKGTFKVSFYTHIFG